MGIWINSFKNDPNIELGILAGYDKNFDVYVGRFWHAGELMPAKVVKAYGAYCSHEGKEIIKDKDFEILLDEHVDWVEGSKGSYPENAITSTNKNAAKKWVIVRAKVQGGIVVGKVHKSFEKASFPLNAKEWFLEDYEVLVPEAKE